MNTYTYPASPAQIRFINTLLAERDAPQASRDYVAHLLDTGISSKRASDAIAHLKGFVKIQAQQELAIAAIARPRPTEPGFYLVDGEVFKVVETRDGERLYAKKTTAHGLEYVPGAMTRIFADQKLSPEQIAEQGLTQGFCIVCSSEFEDPTSKHIGIGPVCGKNTLGAEAYKALRLSVADRPDVIAFEAAKKAAAKARREAKKAESEQLALV
ncbi:hypothetical protein M181_gp228 [Mycobacterium phage Gizmo]|uniref:Capsid decoration protein n=1 Tax=Mycobacterium phage Gizmo TaxID=1327936 RepID=R4TDK6_9CAUD|nr:hypothetical protein M181_gp228 [Mycobacterium phage Gizmo]AGM13395.1 hypothetical protein PBI_GIZMO_105 [Mycobacterium phage Gizmo]